MPCFFAILGLFFPRIVLLLLWLTTDYLKAAYSGVLWPILGFLFAPFTTLAYAFAMHDPAGLGSWRVIIFILAILMDLGAIGGGKSALKRKKKD